MATRTRATVLGLLAAVVLAGCKVQPKLLLALAQQDDDVVIVEVAIPATDAAKIKSRELYTYVRVGDCQKMADGYPAEAQVGGTAGSNFSFATEGRTVKMSGKIPAHIFEKYQMPCAALEGGGYFTGTLESVPIAVKMGPVH